MRNDYVVHSPAEINRCNVYTSWKKTELSPMDDVTGVLSLFSAVSPCLTNTLKLASFQVFSSLGWWPVIHNDTRTRARCATHKNYFLIALS